MDNQVPQGMVRIDPFVIDRRSRYAATAFPVRSEAEFAQGMKQLLRVKRYRQADHHIVAYRIKTGSGGVRDYKNDGYRSPSKEAGAGMLVLEALRQAERCNLCVVVTRWYGGVHLGPDRFKHVKKAAEEIMERIPQ